MNHLTNNKQPLEMCLPALGAAAPAKNCGGICCCGCCSWCCCFWSCCCCCCSGCCVGFTKGATKGLLAAIFVSGCGRFSTGDSSPDDWEKPFFSDSGPSPSLTASKEDLITLTGRAAPAICAAIDCNVTDGLRAACGIEGTGGGSPDDGMTGGEVGVGLAWDPVASAAWLTVLVGEFSRGMWVAGAGAWNWRPCVGDAGADLKWWNSDDENCT